MDPPYLFTMLAFIAFPSVLPSVRPFVHIAHIARAYRTSGLCRSHGQPELAPVVYSLAYPAHRRPEESKTHVAPVGVRSDRLAAIKRKRRQR